MQRLERWSCHVNGPYSVDGFLGRQVVVELCRDGVALWERPGGRKHFIPTDQQPGPGLRPTSLVPLAPLFPTSLVERREPARPGLRVATAPARRLRDFPSAGTVRLLNPGPPSPVLDDCCTRVGLECLSLDRQPVPLN